MGERLCRITQESLYLALRMVKPGINLREIGAAIQKFVEAEASPSFVNIADTVLVAASTKNRRCCTMTPVKPTSC